MKNLKTEECALCIVGAGITGLNALYAAGKYLKKTDRIIIVDKRSTYGGMWDSAYDYVKLHMAHPFFTVGDMKWKIKRHRSYLANRFDIMAHLHDCAGEIKKKNNVTEYWGYDYKGYEEVYNGETYQANVHIVAPDGNDVVIKAKRFIHAVGANIKRATPFVLSSKHVKTICPEDYGVSGIQRDNKPIYVIGSGKTGLDTVYKLAAECKGRAIHLIAGRNGRAYFRRETLTPGGIQRHLPWSEGASFFFKLALQFDGHNEKELMQSLTGSHFLRLQPAHSVCMFGIISEHEINVVDKALTSITNERLQDVKDKDDTPHIIPENGESMPVEKGSWFINCTGYLYDKKLFNQPYLSQHRTALMLNVPKLFPLHYYEGYFLTHLFCRGQLHKVPLYEINYSNLSKNYPDKLVFITTTQMMYNFSILARHLPLGVMMNNRIFNAASWYPLNGIIQTLKFNWKMWRHAKSIEKKLEKYEELFGEGFKAPAAQNTNKSTVKGRYE